MSFSGGKRPFYSSSSLAVLLLIVASLYIWTSTQNQVGAIRVFPRRSSPVEEESQAMASPPPPPARTQTQIFREYFKRRVTELNRTAEDTFLDYKRKIPSCPDPLHN